MRQIIPEESYMSERDLFIGEWIERACRSFMRVPPAGLGLPKEY